MHDSRSSCGRRSVCPRPAPLPACHAELWDDEVRGAAKLIEALRIDPDPTSSGMGGRRPGAPAPGGRGADPDEAGARPRAQARGRLAIGSGPGRGPFRTNASAASGRLSSLTHILWPTVHCPSHGHARVRLSSHSVANRAFAWHGSPSVQFATGRPPPRAERARAGDQPLAAGTRARGRVDQQEKQAAAAIGPAQRWRRRSFAVR